MSVIWTYATGGASKERFARKHDNILMYQKGKTFKFYPDRILEDRTEKSLKRAQNPNGARISTDNLKKLPTDVWQIQALNPMAVERIGYPTQKPEELLKKIILGCSDEGDVIADFFSGGGTTVTVAEKLNRRWIGCDISRIAVSVTRDRIASIYNSKTGIERKSDKPSNNFSVEYHGVYERDLVRELEPLAYRKFILDCYQSVPKQKGDYIHGFKEDRAIYVAPANKNLKKDQIEDFHFELEKHKINNGVILAWNISKDAEKYVDDLRRGTQGPAIQIIQVKLVDIDSNEFKGENIRFINKPVAVIKSIQKNGLNWVFDASASCGTNGSEIHYYQWDFNYKNRFSPYTKSHFKDDDKAGNPLNENKKIEFTFNEEGNYKVALRIFDKSGAEANHVIDIKAFKALKKAS